MAKIDVMGDPTMRTRSILTVAAFVAAGAVLGWLAASGRNATVRAEDNKAQINGGTLAGLPRPDFPSAGTVGPTILDSDKPQFPQPVQPPKGAPNVVLILLDDTGFGQYSTFGGGIRRRPSRNLLTKDCATTASTR